MATIEELIAEHSARSLCDSLRVFQKNPELVPQVFESLTNAGFHDFKWVGAGTSSFLVSPSENDKIVFRIKYGK
jgi:hypothetical protein